MKIAAGMMVVHRETGEKIRVLCNCPHSSPRAHTRRAIEQNISLYRLATHEELQEAYEKCLEK